MYQHDSAWSKWKEDNQITNGLPYSNLSLWNQHDLTTTESDKPTKKETGVSVTQKLNEACADLQGMEAE